ncbi:TonB-linked outer membrane protein, SusC/RagA family [Segatella baroniae F0067]|uniref:TonB-linked outer membrane protein, SusC/RagA family n=1 Tax=Segatella baroniae F0067 TaxID=1115809 RepID=U2NQN3_9BACT|nr:SusC/RagA family TonB-linked outer membrane protein [Segatella baroniae]ERK40355.1 TonB-linked outer membrane protein, SusC/RagA family [Segatella baroniae F0067]
MQKRLSMFLACLFLSLGMAMAQVQVSGTVVSSEDNEPIIGASVKVKGTALGTITNMDGEFHLSVSSNAHLVVSYIGMKTQEVAVKTGKMRIVLHPDNQTLNEVVVTGMQKMDKRLFSGAASKLDAAKSKLDGVPDVSRALEGRVAGVSVQNVSGTFGTAPKIRVRGATSIYGSSKPLWVVDGVIMEDVTEVSADALSSGDAATLISSAIAGLNSDDIESFQILKDGSATSIYGARAMGGVIVVTTKKGKAGTSRINYTGEFTMRLKPSYSQFNIMNSQEQMGIYKEMYNAGLISFSRTLRASNSGVYGRMYQLINTYDATNGKFGIANTQNAMNEYLQAAEMRNTDWFDELFNNSISMNHSISMQSGTDKAQYYTSFSYMNDPGWTEQSKVQRYTYSINANYNLSKKVTLNLIGNTSYRKQRAPGTTTQKGDAVSGAVSRDFDINPYSYAINTSRALDPNVFYTSSYAPFNIHHELANNFMDFDVLDMKVQAELKYKPITKVELAVLGAYKFSNTVQNHQVRDNSNFAMAYRAMDDATIRDANPWLYQDPDQTNSKKFSVLEKGGFQRETKYKMNSWDFRATASYNDVYNDDHIVNFYGGMEVNNTDRFRTHFDAVGVQYQLGMLGSYDYHYFKQLSEEGGHYFTLNNTYGRDVSFFGTANYSWKGRYSANLTTRYEGSNRLGKARSARWLPTWNVSGAWNAHEEPWFRKVFNNTLTHATIRASYSLTGDKPAVANSQVILKSVNPWRPFSSDQESALEVSDFANPELTYEKKHEFNIGTDLGFLDNRINVTFDWYTRNNYDLLGPRTTNGTKGTITEFANIASMKSHGEELGISTKNIMTKDFQWNTDFIFSHVKTKVTKLDNRSQIFDMISGVGFTRKGDPYRALYSMDFKGLNENGIPTFINEKGELTTSEIEFQSRVLDYLVYEGPTDPTVTGSLGNTFSYKGWHLNVFATYAFGNKVRLDPAFKSSYSDLSSMPKDFKNRWTVSGDERRTSIPAIADLRTLQNDLRLANAYNAYNFSTDRVAKGDFIRMKEISVSYDFPHAWVNALSLNTLNLKLQATNLFLIYSDKKLNGQDPEFFNAGGVAVPMARQFTLTLRLGL